MESHKEIEEHAAQWLLRREAADWSAADESELASWIAASTAHEVAFIRLEAAWVEARRLKALGAGGQVGVVPPPGLWHASSFFPERSETENLLRNTRARRVRAFAAAVCIVLTVVVASYFSFSSNSERYATPIGGVSIVPLQDGSHVTLNTASEVRIDLTSRERHIRLEKGEAFFEVAKDPARPFVVQVGSKRVIAVGTQFSVRRNGDDICIAVSEGKVRVEDASASLQSGPERREPGGKLRSMPVDNAQSPAATAGRHSGQVFVAAGAIARTTDDGIVVQENALPEVEDSLSWRSGYLVFRDAVLAAAIIEFNRYNERKIVIEDPEVAALRVSGKFRSTNFEAFVRLLEEGFAVRARAADGHIILGSSRR